MTAASEPCEPTVTGWMSVLPTRSSGWAKVRGARAQRARCRCRHLPRFVRGVHRRLRGWQDVAASGDPGHRRPAISDSPAGTDSEDSAKIQVIRENTDGGEDGVKVTLTTELQRTFRASTIFVLDESTGGLHPVHARNLIAVFGRLVDAGSNVIAVEHNMAVVSASDWVVELGPDGGDKESSRGELSVIRNPGDECASLDLVAAPLAPVLAAAPSDAEGGAVPRRDPSADPPGRYPRPVHPDPVSQRNR